MAIFHVGYLYALRYRWQWQKSNPYLEDQCDAGLHEFRLCLFGSPGMFMPNGGMAHAGQMIMEKICILASTFSGNCHLLRNKLAAWR